MAEPKDGWAELNVDEDTFVEIDLGSGDDASPDDKETPPKQEKASETPKKTEIEADEAPEPKRKNTAQDRIRELIEQRNAERAARAAVEAERDALKAETLKVGSQTAEYAQGQLKEKLAVLKAQLKTAYENGDAEAIADLTIKVSDTQLEGRQLKAYQESLTKRVEVPKQVEKTAEKQYPPEAIAWVQKNQDWWEKDRARTAAAYDFEELLRKGNMDPRDPEFYDELDRLLEAKFGASQKREERQPATSRPREMVSGSSRVPSKGNKVRFTQSEYEAAKRKWGFKSPEDYARHLASAEKSSEAGEYTTLDI